MQEQGRLMKSKAIELLKNGTVDRVIGWKPGEFSYDMTPGVFSSAEEIENSFVFNDFCAANVSKYLVKETKKEGRILAFLKPCDTYSFNQLVKEHRIDRDKVYVVGIECYGKCDINKIKEKGAEGIVSINSDGPELIVDTVYGAEKIKKLDVYSDRCLACKSKKHVAFDELIGEDGEVVEDCNRFDMVEKLENMTADERYEFWRNELSRCIRCNACRDVCPACTCEKCVFDNPNSGIENKSPANSFEENLFHIIRSYHVAGRCTDCGECSRVCPQHIPLHLLNRKYIKDINELYGDFQAGEDTVTPAPLTDFTKDDCEPSIVKERGVQ